jgi:hypothetical protein
MQKTAQKRYLSRLQEMTNISGRAAEKFFDPELKKIMDTLRKVDDNVRSIASGEPLGSGDPGKDPVSLKELLKKAKSNIGKKEYMLGVADLNRFHSKYDEIMKQLVQLKDAENSLHAKFLLPESHKLAPEHKNSLEDLEKKFAEQQFGLQKEAGLMDFLYQFGTRGRSLAFYEKRFPKDVAALKTSTTNLFASSEKLLNELLSSLKEMASSRANRDPQVYKEKADKIIGKFKVYDTEWRTAFTGVFKPLFEKKRAYEAMMAGEKLPGASTPPTAEQLANQPIPGVEKRDAIPGMKAAPSPEGATPSLVPTPTVNAPMGTWVSPTTSPFGSATTPSVSLPGGLSGGLEPAKIPDERPTDPVLPVAAPVAKQTLVPPVTMPKPGPRPPPRGKQQADDGLSDDSITSQAHRKFFLSLETLSNESPALLAAYIKKYAQAIQVSDPETAIGLFKIIRSIRS